MSVAFNQTNVGNSNISQIYGSSIGVVYSLNEYAQANLVTPSGGGGWVAPSGSFVLGGCVAGDGNVYAAGGPGGGSGITRIWQGIPGSYGSFSSYWDNGTASYIVNIFEGPGGNVWGSTYTTGELVKFDITSHAFTRYAISSYNLSQMIYDGTYLWFTDGNGTLWQVDSSGTPTSHVIAAGVTTLYGPTFDLAGNIWIGDSAGNAYKVSSAGTLLATYSGKYINGGALGTSGLIWCSGNVSGNIASFDPTTLAVINYPLVGVTPAGIGSPAYDPLDKTMWWGGAVHYGTTLQSYEVQSFISGNPIVTII